MKRIVFTILILALSASLAACGGDTKPPSDNTSATTADAIQTLDTSKSTPTPELDTNTMLDEDGLSLQFQQVADACSDIINSFVIDIDKGVYPLPTLEEYMALSATIGAFGYPVDYYELDMPNYEKLMAFANDVQTGKDAQLVVYQLYNWGITAEVLESRSGSISYRMYSCDYPSYDTTNYSPKFMFDHDNTIDKLEMTDSGLLSYRFSAKDGNSEQYQGYRVVPLGEENRGYTRKYMTWISNAPGSILGETWDKDTLGDLNMINVFESLYCQAYGDFPSQYTVDSPNDGEAIRQVPADVMEGIMLNGLPITTEQLREFIPYDEAQKSYNYHMESMSSMGYYDVVGSVKNADSSLTLTIEVVPVDFIPNDIRTYSLTVMDNPDGSIKYISNMVMMQ